MFRPGASTLYAECDHPGCDAVFDVATLNEQAARKTLHEHGWFSVDDGSRVAILCITHKPQNPVAKRLQETPVSAEAHEAVAASVGEHFPKWSEAVDHPLHYGGADNPYEAIKVIEAWQLDFNLGNAAKYICRAGKKGDALEDLRKSRWYLERAIKNLETSAEKMPARAFVKCDHCEAEAEFFCVCRRCQREAYAKQIDEVFFSCSQHRAEVAEKHHWIRNTSPVWADRVKP
jgi:hypothetical protein